MSSTRRGRIDLSDNDSANRTQRFSGANEPSAPAQVRNGSQQRKAHYDQQRTHGAGPITGSSKDGMLPKQGAVPSAASGREARERAGLGERGKRDLTEVRASGPKPTEERTQSQPFYETDENRSEKEERDLNEVSAPAPAQPESPEYPSSRPHRKRRESVLEDGEDDLNEVAAPSPVQAMSQNRHFRRESYLGDAPEYDEQTEKEKRSEDHKPAVSPMVTRLYIVSSLVLFSILGTLARLGTQWITFYPGSPSTFSNLWANVGGTLIMGFLAEDRKIFQQEWGTGSAPEDTEWNPDTHPRGTPERLSVHLKTKKTIPLYIGLTIGFCGSYTSFSSFERDVFLALANKMPTPLNHPADAGASPTSSVPRDGGYSFEAVIAVIVLTITASIGALKFGAHTAILLDRFTPTLPFRLIRRLFDPVIAFLGIGCWIGAIVMAIVAPDRAGGPAYHGHAETWRGQVLFALVFAPLGCLLRFYLSLKLNGMVPWFPLGTFTANIFGTAVLGMAYDLQRAPLQLNTVVGGGRTGCQVLQGVQDGFCGCLTTVSTWIVELTTLRRRHAYSYGFTSVAVALGLLVVIIGSVSWTVGFVDPACVVEIS